jgi:PAT family beta-lactamase induction signal transducer AmpG
MMTETVPKQAVAEIHGPSGPKINPILFIPLLYFMQAIPVTIVQDVASIIYKDLGIADAPILQWTGLISLPWSLQLLLGPLVDLNSTKRKWIFGGQALITIGLIATALLLQMPYVFEITLLILGATAVTSALCNIATDGFYIIAMSKEDQAKYVGIQTTSYRLGRLFCTGILVLLAGLLINAGVSKPTAWMIVLIGCSAIYGVGYLAARKVTPHAEEDRPADAVGANETGKNIGRSITLVALGVSAYFLLNAVVRLVAHWIWQARDATLPVKGADGKAVITGLQGWMLPDDNKIAGFSTGLGGVGTEVAQLIACGVLVVLCMLVARILLARTAMADALTSYVKQSGFPAILGFILFYRLGEAMVSRTSPLFLKGAEAAGGLGVDDAGLGLIKIFGIFGIVCGGIAGGFVVSKYGLKRAFWPIAILMHIPNLLYLWASHARPPFWVLPGIDFFEQFGYGFGFAGYMLYMMQVAQRGHYKTSHYAIGSGLGALCVGPIAGAVSAKLLDNFGYQGFFAGSLLFTLPGLLMLFFIPLDETPKAVAA